MLPCIYLWGKVNVAQASPRHASECRRQPAMVRRRRIDTDPDATYMSFLKTRRGAPDVVVVIPSTGRAQDVCTKTISALLQHGIQQSDIHVFVAPGNIGSVTQISVYRASLMNHNLSEVRLHLGSSTLTGQYNCIAQHFSEGQYLLMCSDNISRIIHRKGERTFVTEELPAGHFCAITAHAYHCMKARKCFTWSLGCCKAPRNMSPGTLSMKFGLLDGNCYGVLNRRLKVLRHVGSVFTTDLEWSCRSWTQDGSFFRYLHVAAEKQYRSKGGHLLAHTASQRWTLTAKGIKQLAAEFPSLVTFDGLKKTSLRGQPYRLHHVGRRPTKMCKHIQNRGRPLVHFKHRPATSAERVRACRARRA